MEQGTVGNWRLILALLLPSCVTLDKAHPLSEPQFSHLENGDVDNYYLIKLGWRLDGNKVHV